MERGHVSPNLKTEPSENYIVEGPQDEGGVDTNIAGPSESLVIKLEINQSIEAAKFKSNNDNAETLEFGNKNITDTIIQNKESEKNHYICKFCSKVFNKHQALGGHMNGHSKDQRNLDKFGKVATWIHETYPTPLNTALVSEVELQGTPIHGVACNSYNPLVEVGDVHIQLGAVGGQWTTQQSTHQIQLSQDLQTQQRQQLQNHQAQELQNYQSALGVQNYQTPQGPQYYQASQGSQNHQTIQQFQNYQIPQRPPYYLASQGSQNYQAPQGLQSYEDPQRSQRYLTSQGLQQQQLVADANNQQKINLNSEMSNKPMSLAKVPSNEQKSISSNSQGSHFQEEARGPQRYMPNLHNLRYGDRLTTGPFINEEMNKKFYARLGPNVLKRSNQMISTPHNYDTVAQYRPINSSNTSGSFIQSKDD